MTEWGVVGVIAALVALIGSLIKPIISLTRSITELTVVVRDLRTDMDEHREHSHESHRRLWEHNEKQDKELHDHERRISKIEGGQQGG